MIAWFLAGILIVIGFVLILIKNNKVWESNQHVCGASKDDKTIPCNVSQTYNCGECPFYKYKKDDGDVA